MKLSFSRWEEALRVAFAATLAHRLRSVLTVLGIVIGIAVVTVVAALIEGAQEFINRTAAGLGPGIVRIDKASFQDFIGDAQSFAEARAKRPDVSLEEYRRLRDRVNERLIVGARIDAALPVGRGNRTLDGVAVQGGTSNLPELTTVRLDRGRFLTDFDDLYRRPVCLIGKDVDEYLFPETEALGKLIRLGGTDYEVVGVAAPLGASIGASQDGFVVIPLGTFTRLFGARSRSIAILVKARPELPVDNLEVEELTRIAMRLERGLQPGEEDNFSLTTAKSIEAFAGRITAIVALVLYPLTGIALAVAGVVVMNMMLASVTERTREIGVRLAIGARRGDILIQFLIESTLLTFTGGLIGVLTAGMLVKVASLLTGFPLSVPVWALLAALVVSSSIGTIFGVVPARRASRLDPIEALRRE
ncbi:MAG: FtsX-like permease family protein [Acidobacteria bacterium]|nr:FtsX-like permease family protein [Acidobacteriota bacterium]